MNFFFFGDIWESRPPLREDFSAMSALVLLVTSEVLIFDVRFRLFDFVCYS